LLPEDLRREIQEGILRLLERDQFVVAVAPTGSGKSRIAVHRRDLLDRFGKAVHVLPMRSLVEELAADLACVYGDLVGYQAGIRGIAVARRGERCELLDPLEQPDTDAEVLQVEHDPYMAHPYTVTTYDSYSLSLLLSPVPEIHYSRFGHPDLSFALLSAGLTIFDEVHLLAPDDVEKVSDDSLKAWAFIAAATATTLWGGGALLYSTATVSPALLSLASTVIGRKPSVVLASTRWIRDEFSKVLTYSKIEFVDLEREATDAVSSYTANLFTYVFTEEPWQKVEEICRKNEYERILVVLNTVERAVETYERVRGVCEASGYTALLVHGRMSHLHRASIGSRIRRLKRSERFVVVATQVVEAGVDLDADVLVSDVAPPDSLIQRAGRVLRHSIRRGLVAVSASEGSEESCRRVYGSACRSVASKLKDLVEKCSYRVDWRFGAPERCTVYRLLLASSQKSYIGGTVFRMLVGDIMNLIFTRHLEDLSEAARRLEEAFEGSVVRDSLRIPIIVTIRGVEDVAEVPAWYAERLLGAGLLGGFRVRVYDQSGREVDKPFTLPATEALRQLSKRPFTFMRSVVTKLRAKFGRDVYVAVEGFLYQGVYDEVRGFA